jgi:hypothetical protein
VIEALLEQDFEPVLAGDGASLELLRREFPELRSYELPSTEVQYPNDPRLLKYKLLLKSGQWLSTVRKEKRCVAEIHKKEGLSGIISDNRFGVRLRDIPSVYMTHQVRVLSGKTSFLTSAIHQKIIAGFDECWIPDDVEDPLAGKLSSPPLGMKRVKFIGNLSRFKYSDQKIKWDVMVLLSGPEPQRSILELRTREALSTYPGKCILVQGRVQGERKEITEGNTTIVNFMLREELETALLQSKMVVARSGYSTVMDLQALRAKVFFMPTPGQYEQEYLAVYLKERGVADFSGQNIFNADMLERGGAYPGFTQKKTSKKDPFGSLFDVFNEGR